MSGKPRYKLEQVLDAVAGSHGIVSLACKKLGCSWDCLDSYRRKYPQVAAGLTTAREETLDYAESRLFELIKSKNLIAILFFLKTQGKHRGWIERQEISDSTGSEPMSLAERLKQVHQLEKRQRVKVVHALKSLPILTEKEADGDES